MREFRTISTSTTTREIIENFNVNARSDRFIDYVLGTVLSNGLLFTGKESIDGSLIFPMKKVELSGVVNSNTIFDNFRMYFREADRVIELNQFPVDLTAFADNKPHFLYIKENLTYRVSDYIFGKSDEVMLCRFIINTDSTWQQVYITAQRAGTPMYDAAEEFYKLNGIYVRSPGGLELSHTNGTVKRSGIEFYDTFSPDLYSCSNTANERVPIRYTNLKNEIDYTQPVTYDVDPNHYMVYDFNSKKRTNSSERIRNILNLIYNLSTTAKNAAADLRHALSITTEQQELKRVANSFIDFLNNVYIMVADFASYITDPYFSTIDKTELDQNIIDFNNYIDTYFGDSVDITDDSVTRIEDAAYFLISGRPAVCANSQDYILGDMYEQIQALPVGEGELKDVTPGKFTIQRILWDIYEKCLILQYGDMEYDTFENATAGTGAVLYPVPFGRLFYIPLANIVIKQGATDINSDDECVIITNQNQNADEESTTLADYVARALATKAIEYIYDLLDGTRAVGKADSLKHTDLATGTTIEYHDGDFFLNYDNLRNKLVVVNDLNETSFDSRKVLSAYQGAVLNSNKLARDGSQAMTGTLNAQHVIPVTTNTYDLGSVDKQWRALYVGVRGILTDGNIVPKTSGVNSLGNSDAYWGSLYSNYISAKTINSEVLVLNNPSAEALTVNGRTYLNENVYITGNYTYTGTHLVTKYIDPDEDNKYSIGASNYRYSNIYAVKGTFTDLSVAGNIVPANTNTSDIGSSSKRFRNGYFNNVNSTNGTFTNLKVTNLSTSDSNEKFVVSGGNGYSRTVTRLEAYSKSNAEQSTRWNSFQNGTVVVCW